MGATTAEKWVHGGAVENLYLPSPDSFGSNLTPKALTSHTQNEGKLLVALPSLLSGRGPALFASPSFPPMGNNNNEKRKKEKGGKKCASPFNNSEVSAGRAGARRRQQVWRKV